MSNLQKIKSGKKYEESFQSDKNSVVCFPDCIYTDFGSLHLNCFVTDPLFLTFGFYLTSPLLLASSAYIFLAVRASSFTRLHRPHVTFELRVPESETSRPEPGRVGSGFTCGCRSL